MDADDRTNEDGPRRAGAIRAPLVRRERRLVAGVAGAPVLLALLLLLPLGLTGRWTWAEVVWSALVFGGLLGLASGFVGVDRLQARRCSGCGDVNTRGAHHCVHCGYDLTEVPRWSCEERHLVFVDPGLCDCGRRLHRIAPPRGVGAEVAFTLKFGAWLFGFLVLCAAVLSVAG